jgi:accessory colonization factor AcfC
MTYLITRKILNNKMISDKEKTIPIEKLTPNMTLARDITKPNGDLIFGQSGKLTESIIERLKRFGVRKVSVLVKEEDEYRNPEYIKKKIKEIEEGLDYRFRKVNRIPLMIELKGLLAEYLKGKLIS